MNFNRKIKAKWVYLTVILLLSLTLIQAVQFTYAQSTNSPWAIGLKTQKIGQNSTSNVFAPFDQIQLNATVTYSNASQPNMLVTLMVEGPTNSSNQIKIARIETTNSKGIATFSFRLPIENKNQSSFIGAWQATAIVQTTNGTIQKNLNFTTQWPIQFDSITLLNAQNQSQQVFAPGNPVLVNLAVKNLGYPQSANISISMKDSAENIINQIQLQNQTITSNSTQFQASLQIPENAPVGQSTITAAIYNGSYQSVDIPIAESKIAYFTIAVNGTSTITPTLTPTPSPAPTPTATATPVPTIIENTISLFSWTLVATGLFTFTLLYMFLKRRPMLKINTQMPIISTPTLSQTTITTTTPSVELPQNSSLPATTKIAPPKTLQATVTQLPSIYDTIGIPKPNSETEKPEESKQTVVSQLVKISSIGQRVQNLETELKLEREQLAKEVITLNRSLEEQEKAVKNYFDTIRQEVAKLAGETNASEQPKKTNNEGSN
jgi:hypothetical protein